MNCSQIQEKLALLVYGDLDHDEAAKVQSHLSECDLCKSKFEEFSRVRETLDVVSSPNVIVEVDRIPAEAGLSPNTNHSIPWKKIALAATAALILVACVFSIEVRIDAHQLIVRWGIPPAQRVRDTKLPIETKTIVPREQRHVVSKVVESKKLDERVRVLDDLVHALADEFESYDRRQSDALLALQKRCGVLERDARKYRAESNRDLTALYTAYFQNISQGENQ